MRWRVPPVCPLRHALAAGLLVAAFPAAAQDYDDPSGHALTLAGDLRLTGADGEPSWIDGGYGKSRFGGTRAGDFDVEPRAVEADVVWKPELGWSTSATIAAIAQDGQDPAVDLSEAYLSWRRNPHDGFRLSARAGVFWPSVSLEHSGPEWRVTETITPSAINSWIGEEVKTGGIEATGSLPVGSGRLHGTLALFGFNDTSGTLLAFRGWALHDEKATLFGRQPLPLLYGDLRDAQAAATRPAIELDSKPGFYAKLDYRADSGFDLQAFYYDNRGDPEAVDDDLQWGWRTRFIDLGARLTIDPATKITAQALTGSTRMGYPIGDRIWVDTAFRSAFVLVTRDLGGTTLSARGEAFGTRGRGSLLGADESEDGWAATIAARHPIGEHLNLLIEALHIDSRRDARSRLGLDPRQRQTAIQLALRLRR